MKTEIANELGEGRRIVLTPETENDHEFLNALLKHFYPTEVAPGIPAKSD
jgi:hypothetical protein